MIKTENLLQQVIDLTKEVGEFIRQESSAFDKKQVEHKGFNDLVSYVDKTAEQRLIAGLSKIDPEAGFIAEEGSGSQAAERNWIIDPLDGTTNFVHGLPVYAISVALHHEDMQMGVVYDVANDDCYSASRGMGATLNNRPIKVSPHDTIAGSLIATGFPYYNFEQLPAYLEILKSLMKESHGIRRMGSAAIDLALTASGKFEGFFEYNLNPWDVAAGALIVQEAGGIVSEFDGGGNFTFGRSIVASGPIHKEMLEVIQSHWPL